MIKYKIALIAVLTITFLLSVSTIANAESHDLQNLRVTPGSTLGPNANPLKIEFDLDNDIIFHATTDREWYTVMVDCDGLGMADSTFILANKQPIEVPASGSHVTVYWDASNDVTGACGYCNVRVEVYEDDPIYGTYYMVGSAFTGSQMFDYYPPVIYYNILTGTGPNGWYNTPVTIRFTCYDYCGYSGLSYPEVKPGYEIATKNVVVSTSGAGVSVTEHATDGLGNTAYCTASGLYIDMVKPVATYTASPAPNAAGWFNRPVTFTFGGTDTLSGFKSASPGSSTLNTEGSSISTTSTVSDNAGNTNTTTFYAKIDMTKPHTTAALSGTMGSNNWYNGNVVMTLTASDALSGVKQLAYSTDNGAHWVQYDGPVTFSTEGLNTVLYRSVDNADNLEDAHSVSFSIDRSNPAISVTLTPSPNLGGWNNGDVVVHFPASDSVSGVASVTPDQTVSAEVYHQPVTGTATDNSGRSASATVYVSVDWTVPDTTCSLAGTIGTNGWNTSNVVMTLTPVDSLSGVKRTEYSINNGASWTLYGGPVTFSMEGTTTVLYRSVDNADNVEDAHSISIKIDKTVPATSCSLAGALGGDGWNTTDVVMALSATDDISGIARKEYSMNGGSSWTTYGSSVTFSNPGNAAMLFRSVDSAGNVEASRSVSFKIDEAAPVTSYNIIGTEGDNGWFTSDVSVTLSASDLLADTSVATSGVDKVWYQVDGGTWQEYAGSFPVNGDGMHTVQLYSVDLAGNVEATKSVTINIDTIAPSSDASLSGTMGNNSWYISNVTLAITASDGESISPLAGRLTTDAVAVSDVARIEYSVDAGATWETYIDPVQFSDDGPVSVQYRAVDGAGLVGDSGSVGFKVDRSKPVQLPVLSGSKSVFGWYDSDVRLVLPSGDGMSGLYSMSYSMDGLTWRPYTGEVIVPLGMSGPVYYGSVDNAGNRNNGTVYAYFQPLSFGNPLDWVIARQIESALNVTRPTPTPVPGSSGGSSNGSTTVTVTPTPVPGTTSVPAEGATPVPTAASEGQSGLPLVVIMLLVVVVAAGGVLFFFVRKK